MTSKKAVVTRTMEVIVEEDYMYSTDLTTAGRYMPALRRSARALVRYRDKLNGARQRVLQVGCLCVAVSIMQCRACVLARECLWGHLSTAGVCLRVGRTYL